MVVFIWTALALGGVFMTSRNDISLGDDLTLPGNQESVRAANLIESRLNGEAASTAIYCNQLRPLLQSQRGYQRGELTSTESPFEVAGCVDEAEAGQPVDDTGRVNSPVDTDLVGSIELAGTPRETLVDLTAALITFNNLAEGKPDSPEVLGHPLYDQVKSATKQDLRRTELIGLALGAMLLLVIVRSFVTTTIALFATCASILAALGATALLHQVMPVSVFTSSLVIMFGLAVSIDYSLLLIARYREELGTDSSPAEAWSRTIATAGRTVTVAAVAAACSLAGLILVPITIIRSLAAGIVIAILMSLTAALTLLPALLQLVGRRAANSNRGQLAQTNAVSPQCLSKFPVRHAGVTIACVVLVLTPLIVQLPGMSLGFSSLPGVGNADTSESSPQVQQRMFELAQRAFSVVEIAVETPRSEEADLATNQLVSALGARDAFHPLVVVQWNERSDLVVISAILTGDTNAVGTLDAVADLRENALPAIFGQTSSTAVGGAPGAKFDSLGIISMWQWRIAAGVLVASLLLLLLTFHSIAIAVKSVVMNVLSTCAALGALIGLFQHGWGSTYVRIKPTGSIEIWVPLVLFCVLFGLSTNYHLFLLSRIREHYGQTLDNRLAIETGLHKTSRLIAGASLIMASVFASFVRSDIPGLQQLGAGLAIAVVLDATIIRAMLLPALMTLLGTWNWYLPRRLAWIPDFGIRALPSDGK